MADSQPDHGAKARLLDQVDGNTELVAPNKTGSIQDEAPKPTADESKRSKYLLISFVLMIFIGLGNRILNILQFVPMQNYPLFVNLLTTFAYLPTSLLYIVPVIKYRKDLITPEARAVPQKVWIIMGTLDSIAGVMQSLALDKINNGGLVVLLLQSAIPMSMLITRLFLKVKYRMSQYIGAMLVIAGIIVVLVPQLINPSNNGVTPSATGIWSAVLIASCIPMCLSSVYKEKALGDTEIDAVYMNYWIAVYQFIISFPLLVPMAYASDLTVQELPSNLWNGMKCYVGINSITTGPHIDDCSSAPIYVNVYILFNLAYNVLIILLLKYGSSNILYLCITLQVPISNLAFALPFMPNSQPVTWEAGLGLAVIMGGLVIYRFFTPLKGRIYKTLGWQLPESKPAGAKTADAEQSAGLLAAGGEGAGSDGSLLVGGESPSQMSGSTPIRGLHAHFSKGKKGGSSAAARAEAVSAARSSMQAPAAGQGATQRRPSQ